MGSEHGSWDLERRSCSCGHGLSFSVACGIFPDKGLNLCPLRWQMDSLPLRHQGGAIMPLYIRHVRAWHGKCSVQMVLFLYRQMSLSILASFLQSISSLVNFSLTFSLPRSLNPLPESKDHFSWLGHLRPAVPLGESQGKWGMCLCAEVVNGLVSGLGTQGLWSPGRIVPGHSWLCGCLWWCMQRNE